MQYKVRKQVVNLLSSYEIPNYPLYKLHWLAPTNICSCKHNSSWVASYIHACTNKTHSIANLEDLMPTLARLCCLYILIAAKVKIKSC